MIKHKLEFSECICRECNSFKNVLFCSDTETFICKSCLIFACKDIETEKEEAIIEENGIEFKDTDSYNLTFDEACFQALEDHLK